MLKQKEQLCEPGVIKTKQPTW